MAERGIRPQDGPVGIALRSRKDGLPSVELMSNRNRQGTEVTNPELWELAQAESTSVQVVRHMVCFFKRLSSHRGLWEMGGTAVFASCGWVWIGTFALDAELSSRCVHACSLQRMAKLMGWS